MWEVEERTRATFYSTLFVVRGVGESQTQFHRVSKLRFPNPFASGSGFMASWQLENLTRVSKLRAALTQKMFPRRFF